MFSLSFRARCVLRFSLMWLIFEYLPSSRATGPPRIRAIDDDKKIVFANLGKAVTLRCPIEADSDSTLFTDWLRDGVSLYLENGYIMSSPGMLKIKTVARDDQGIYVCLATNGYGSVSANVTLFVLASETEDDDGQEGNTSITHPKSASRIQGVSPKIKKLNNKPTSHEVGDSATIGCTAFGVPVPHILWLKDGSIVTGNDVKKDRRKSHSVLNIKNIKKSDAGVYRCIAKNNLGEDQLDFTFRVVDPVAAPTIQSLHPLNATVKIRYNAVFWCEVHSTTRLHIKWLKKVTDEELQQMNNTFRLENDYYRTLTGSEVIKSTDGIHKAKLIISKTKAKDAGIYLCLAVNSKGFTYKNSTLTVLGEELNMAVSSLSTSSPSFLVSTILAVFVILSAIGFVIFLYWRCRSAKKTVTANVAVTCAEAESLTGISAEPSSDSRHRSTSGCPRKQSPAICSCSSHSQRNNPSYSAASAHIYRCSCTKIRT